MRKKVIHLDTQTKKRIVELLAVRSLLLQHRRANLEALAVVFYGLGVGSGFVLLLSIIKTGSVLVAVLLLPLCVGSLVVARKLDQAKQKDLVKIRLR